MANIPHPGHGQVRSFRMPADFWLRRADRCREQHQPLRAVTILRHVSRQEPEAPEMQLEYAVQLNALCCYEVSNRECFDLLSRHPACFVAFGLIAKNMLALGNMGEAMDAYAIYAQYARLFPDALPDWDDDVYDVEDALMALAPEAHNPRLETLLKYASLHIYRGHQEKAEKLLLRSVKSPFPRACPQRDALQALYFHQYGPADKALAYALRAVRGAPGMTGLLLPMAMLLRQLHSPAAVPVLMRAAICAFSAEDERSVCAVAAEMNCYGVATALLGRILKRSPHRMSAVYNLCVLRLRQQSMEGVPASIHRLREIDPDDPAVEKLFAAVVKLEEECAPAQEIKAVGDAQPFYGMRDKRVDVESRICCRDALNQGIESFAAAISSDKRLCRQFISLFSLEKNLHRLLPTLCAALEPTIAVSLLRRLLLVGELDNRSLKTVCWLMREAGVEPPYLLRADQRLMLVNPDEPPPAHPTLMQRLLYRRLKEIGRVCGGGNGVLFALRSAYAMTDQQRKSLAGDHFKAWLPAFRRVSALNRGRPAPTLDSALLSPPRWRAFMNALHILNDISREEEHGTD